MLTLLFEHGGVTQSYASEVVDFDWSTKNNEDSQFEASAPNVSAKVTLAVIDSFLESLVRGDIVSVSDLASDPDEGVTGMALKLKVVDVTEQKRRGLTFVSMASFFENVDVIERGVRTVDEATWADMKSRYALDNVEYHGDVVPFQVAHLKKEDIPVALAWSRSKRLEISNTPFASPNAADFAAGGIGLFEPTQTADGTRYSPLYRVRPEQIIDYGISTPQPPMTHLRTPGVGGLHAYPDLTATAKKLLIGYPDTQVFTIQGVDDEIFDAATVQVERDANNAVVSKSLKWLDGTVREISSPQSNYVVGIMTDLFVVFSTSTGAMRVRSKADGSLVRTITASTSRYKLLLDAGNNVVLANGITISRINDGDLEEMMFFPTVDRSSSSYDYPIGLHRIDRFLSTMDVVKSPTAYGELFSGYLSQGVAYGIRYVPGTSPFDVYVTAVAMTSASVTTASMTVPDTHTAGGKTYYVVPVDFNALSGSGRRIVCRGNTASPVEFETVIMFAPTGSQACSPEAYRPDTMPVCFMKHSSQVKVLMVDAILQDSVYKHEKWVIIKYESGTYAVDEYADFSEWVSTVNGQSVDGFVHAGAGTLLTFTQDSFMTMEFFVLKNPFVTRGPSDPMYYLQIAKGETNFCDIGSKLGPVLRGASVGLKVEAGRIWIDIAGFDNCVGNDTWEKLKIGLMCVPAVGAYMKVYLSKEEEAADEPLWVKVTGVTIRYAGLLKMTLEGIIVE